MTALDPIGELLPPCRIGSSCPPAKLLFDPAGQLERRHLVLLTREERPGALISCLVAASRSLVKLSVSLKKVPDTC